MRLQPLIAIAIALLGAGCSEVADEDGGANGGGDGSGGSIGSDAGEGAGPIGTIWVDMASDAATGPSSSTGTGDDDIEIHDKPGQVCEIQNTGYVTTAFATVDDSNSYASPMLVRELTDDEAWSVGDPLPVRAHEFLNAYGQKITGGLHDEDIDEGLHVGVDARVDDEVDHFGKRLITLAVSLTSFDASDVAVPDVTFVMDTSASMTGEAVERLQAVVRGAGNTISSSRSVAAFTTQDHGMLVRPMTPWTGPAEVDAIVDAAGFLSSEVDFDDTLDLAFDEARTQADASNTPGVVMVVTDGTNPIATDGDRVMRERTQWPPVRVVGVGVGPARSYVDDLLDKLTDESGGAYFYAPSKEAAQEELEARFASLTQIAARNVRLQLDLPPGMAVVAVAGGSGPYGLGASDGQNLGADSSMIFQIYLLADAAQSCDALGLSLDWDDPAASDDEGAHRTYPDDGGKLDVPIWQRFALHPRPSESFVRVEAIIAAADAMRGPTASRIQRAVDSMGGFLQAVPDDPAAVLCRSLRRFCASTDVDCGTCAAD